MRDPDESRKGKAQGVPIPIRVTDRRLRFEDRTGQDEPPAPAPEPRRPTFVAELEARVREAESRLAEAVDLLRRREAEAEEFRIRLRREMEKRTRAEVEEFLREFLEVLDSLDRGVAVVVEETNALSLREGLVQVRDQLFASLARRGVEPMSLLGTEYDPHLAEAVAVSPVENEDEDNKILEEIRRGFMLGDRVIRPAQVRVARRASVSTAAPPQSSDKES